MDVSRCAAIVYKIVPFIDISLRAVHRIEVSGLENYTRSPSTMVVMNHRRDTDGPIMAGVLLLRRGLALNGIMPYFVAREDLFRKGFLTEYLETWPNTARKLLWYLDLRPVLAALHVCPMRRIRERTLGEVLEDVLTQFDDQPLTEVLKPSWVQRFEDLAPVSERNVLTLRNVLKKPYRSLLRQDYGLRKLNRRYFDAMKLYDSQIIESQLQRIVELLERGETVFLTPEGKVSADGHFDRFRAGLHLLVNRPRVPLRVLPMGITYDFMTTGRQSVFLNVGRELTDLQGLSRKEVDATVAKAIVTQLTVTASQLASQLLWSFRANGGRFSATELLERVGLEAQRCADAGVRVDPRLLNKRQLAKRIKQYLKYCVRKRMLVQTTRGAYHLQHELEKPFVFWSVGVMDYINNELASHASLASPVASKLKA
jgi:1-acyl-sn-glycerol-3-phosphate acyltransferase